MEGRQERVEPLDRAYDLSSLSGEVEAVARGDRSMQQCRRSCGRFSTDRAMGGTGEPVDQHKNVVRGHCAGLCFWRRV